MALRSESVKKIEPAERLGQLYVGHEELDPWLGRRPLGGKVNFW
jgi:hypothetical protein